MNYSVKIKTNTKELGELVSLVSTMKHTTVDTVVSLTEEAIPNNSPKRKKSPIKKGRDPRLVYSERENGTHCINVKESLLKLGLDYSWLMNNITKEGTPEHSVKCAIRASKSAQSMITN